MGRAGIDTCDLGIKIPLLYLLSYGPNVFRRPASASGQRAVRGDGLRLLGSLLWTAFSREPAAA